MGKTLDIFALCGLCLLVGGVASVAPADQVHGTTEATSKLHGCAQVSRALTIPFRACHVHESKVTKVIAEISAVLILLNPEEDNDESSEVPLEAVPKLEEYEMCSNKKIQHVAKELVWINRRIWQLSYRLEKLVDAQLQSLKQRKIELVRHLRDLIVYTGDSPASSMQLVSFKTQVDLLDAGFKEALAALDTQRPLRNNVESILASVNSQSSFRSKETRIRSTILDPSRTVAELIQLSKSNPEEMSEALPQLISNRYARKLGNAQMVLDLIKQLPKLVHQMIGYSSLDDAMSANSDLDSFELTALVAQLPGINASITSVSGGIPSPVLARHRQLVDDVWPIYRIFGLPNTTCDFRNVKYERSLNGRGNIMHLNTLHLSPTPWSIDTVPGTAIFTPASHQVQWYASEADVFSTSKRSAMYRHPPISEPFGHWKLVPVQGGKYFKVLNAMHNEVLFADKTEMNPTAGFRDHRRVFLARHDYAGVQDFELNADLWQLECKSAEAE